jgi:hypothetical protein
LRSCTGRNFQPICTNEVSLDAESPGPVRRLVFVVVGLTVLTQYSKKYRFFSTFWPKLCEPPQVAIPNGFSQTTCRWIRHVVIYKLVSLRDLCPMRRSHAVLKKVLFQYSCARFTLTGLLSRRSPSAGLASHTSLCLTCQA